MNRAKIILLGVAVLSGGAAVFLAQRSPAPAPAPVVVAPAPAPVMKTTEVLVAASDLPMGSTVAANALSWQAWPAEGAAAGFIKRSDRPDAITHFTGSIARIAMVAGEPIRPEKLIRADGSGFMSAILPAGKRAVAITIDSRGSNSAGGFILPNDRVDVIRTYRDDEGTRSTGSDVYISETILRNIRVLAIGQRIQEQGAEKVVVGENATLEVDPAQAEVLTLAQRVGQLSLALRSIADTTTKDEAVKPQESGLTIVRFGVSRQSARP